MNFTTKKSEYKAVSECGRYSITWSDHPKEGRYYNVWFGESPRKHLSGTFDKGAAIGVAAKHAEAYQEAV